MEISISLSCVGVISKVDFYYWIGDICFVYINKIFVVDCLFVGVMIVVGEGGN